MSDISDIIGNFDPESVPAQDYSPVPAGWYSAMIAEAEVKDNRARNGKILKLRLDLTGEEYNGRVVFANINLDHPNAKCVEIGRRELAQLSRACEIANPTDSSEFIDKVIDIKLAITEFGGEPSNEVRGFAAEGEKTSGVKTRTASSGVKASRATAPTNDAGETEAKPETPKATGAKKRPWER
jgi:hypothetical protein